MSTYGTDLRALNDLPDPEELCSGEENAAYAIARRHSSAEGCLDEIGDSEPYDSFDIEDYFGANFDETTRDAIEQRSGQVARADEFVQSAKSEVSISTAGVISLEVAAQGADGPFDFVISVDKLTMTILRGS